MKNKIIHGAIPALLMHLSIGSVYAWSVFVNPISEILNKNIALIQFAFSLAIFFLGMSAAFCGKIVEKNITKSGIISVLFFCCGLIVSGFAIKIQSLLLLYLGYGVLMGIGLGIGYLTPCKTLMLWFKDNKGLAMGLSVMGFGFASTIASPLITSLINIQGISKTFFYLAIIYFIPMIISVKLLKKPIGEEEKDKQNTTFRYKDIIKNPKFIILWIIFFINIHCGLSLISSASPIMQTFGATIGFAASTVGAMGIFNGLGRISLATLSDKLKNRIYIELVIFISSLIAILCLLSINNILILMFSLCVIAAMYGSGFSTIAPILSDEFGMDNISKIHGLILSAWGFAGLTGNQMTALFYNLTKTYNVSIIADMILYMIGLCLVIYLCNYKKRG